MHDQRKQRAQPVTYNGTSSDGLEGTVKALLLRRWNRTLLAFTHTHTHENTHAGVLQNSGHTNVVRLLYFEV